jgi:hypothetical protein
MRIRRFIPAAALAAATVLASGAARADTIDGNWCNIAGSKQMSIAGNRIVTPGGHQIDGRYGRHSFAYTVPESEPAAGSPVSMMLINENTIRATVGDAAEPETWHRCEQTS